MAREFEIRREVELPATPEQVWAAVATAAGTTSWLFPMGRTRRTRSATLWPAIP